MIILQYISCFAFLYAATFLLNIWCRNNTKAHWYFLHSIGNWFIVCTSINGFTHIIKTPETALLLNKDVFKDDWDLIMLGTLHIFHAIYYYKDLTSADIFHHLIFIPFNQISQLWPFIFNWPVYQWGYFTKAFNFFSCGLPGAIDYFLLGLVKMGKLDKKVYKRCQAINNIWLRCPGICMCNFICLWEINRIPYFPIDGYYIVITCFFLMNYNAIHYTEQVLLSAGRNLPTYKGTC